MKKIKNGDYTVVTKRNPRRLNLPDSGILLSWKEDKFGQNVFQKFVTC